MPQRTRNANADAQRLRRRRIVAAGLPDINRLRIISDVPLYLVRWPGLVAALITAADEDDLVDILDETANPEGCTWSVYRGPVCIEFTLNAPFEILEKDAPRTRPLQPDQLRIGDVTRICERDPMSAAIPGDSETADKMVDSIIRKAFPAVHTVVDTLRETLPEGEVRAALHAELDVLVKSSWQHEQTKRRADPDSRIAATMGTSPRLVAHWNKQRAAAEERARDAPRPKKKPTRPTGKPKPKKPK